MDNTLSSKEIFVPCLPNCPKKCIRGLLSKLSYAFYPQRTHSDSFQPKRVFLTEEGSTLKTLKRVKKSPTKSLSLHNGEVSDLWIPHPFDKDNIYSLELIPFSEFGPKLKFFPMRPPKQRSSFFVVHTNSRGSSLEKKLKSLTLRLCRET